MQSFRSLIAGCGTLSIMRLPRRQLGLTLVELLVAMTLSLFLIGGVLLTYTSGRAASLETERLSRIQENLRFASDFIVRDVRNAGFRDQLTLTFDQFSSIGEAFAQIGGGGSELTIQYAGRGACGRQFGGGSDRKIIRNTYLIRMDAEGNSNLVCDGEEILDGGNTATAEALIAGVTHVSFEFIRPDGSTVTSNTCDFSTSESLEDACIGVEIQLTFDDDPPRTVELVAAFRNIIVDRIYGR